MNAISIRLPDDLEQRLDAEATLIGRPRSEVIREALTSFLAERERARFMAEYAAEAAAMYRDPLVRQEALEIAEAFLPLENEALDRAEGRTPGESWPEETGQRWWK